MGKQKTIPIKKIREAVAKNPPKRVTAQALRKKSHKAEKKRNWLAKLYRFFVPKNFQAELYRGMYIGDEIKRGKITPKVLPTWWLGKAVRKLIDPKHKMKIGKEKENGG